jgi:fibronectin-binding autotransporter adhesin
MKNGTAKGSKILIAAIAALALATGSTFAQTFTPGETNTRLHPLVAPDVNGDTIQPVPAPPGGRGDDLDAARTWGNTGTDFNTGSNWVGGTAPGAGDNANFTAAEVTNPNLSSSVSIAGLFFKGTGSSGYDVTASIGTSFTLTGSSTSGSGGTSNSDSAAIRSDATSGTNTIDAPLILAPSSGSISTFFNATGGTLILNGAISGSATLSLKNGTIQLNAANSMTGGVSVDATTTVVLGNDNALGPAASTFNINSTTTLQASAPRTLANNVVFNGATTFSGSNAFTFNGAASTAGSNTRTLTVSNTGGVTFGGTFTLNGNSGPETLVFNGTSAVNLNGVVQDGTFGTSGLRYAGTGTMTLNAVNTYTGETQGTIAGGTIVVGASGTLGSGNIRLTAGNVTLTMNGVQQMSSSATLFYVNTDTINLNYSGTTTINGLTVDGVAQAAGVYGAGFLNPDNAFFGTGTITVVPEPATLAMMGLGAGLLLGVQRFRRKLR